MEMERPAHPESAQADFAPSQPRFQPPGHATGTADADGRAPAPVGGHPTALAHFERIVTTPQRADELAACAGKVVGTVCNFVPDELVLAIGAVPVRLCTADPAAAAAGEAFLPRDLCSIVKSTGGSVRGGQGLHGRADLLVVPTPCDGKKKLGAVLAGDKPVHWLDLPARKDGPGAREYWRAQVGALVDRLAELTGQRPTRRALRERIEQLNRRQAAFRRFLELRADDPPRISGRDALIVTQASFTDDADRFTEQLEALCDELEAQPADRPKPPARLLLTGAPVIWPNHKVIDALEATGAVVVADELCPGTQRLYQPTVLRDGSTRAMIDALAERYLLPCTCPCFAEGDDRLRRLLELVEAHRVDGVVYHSLRLCALYDMEAQAVGQALKARGVPMIQLATDLGGEDLGQLRNRIDAFLELLAVRTGGRR